MAVDYASLARDGASPARLADIFISDYFGGKAPTVPINPFQMLSDLGVPYSFRNFSRYEGLYVSAEDDNDIPVVGINADRPITRQRYTAAHELCHHIKDAGGGFMCYLGSLSEVERYAESFAAALLMPRSLLIDQVQRYEVNGKVSLDDALYIADYFGVSFAACINQLAYELKVLEGDTSSLALKRRRSEFGPLSKRAELGLNDLILYRQLFDAGYSYLQVDPTPQARQIFETEYIYHDSRMEGIAIEQEKAAEIVIDLRLNGLDSVFCHEGNQAVIEVAGLAAVYEWVFANAANNRNFSIYDAKEINRKLYSLALHPDYSGSFRQSNTVVLGGQFETTDYKNISNEIYRIGKEVDELLAQCEILTPSTYIERVLDIHHELTVVHPFNDGNGRSLRAFTNLLFLRYGLPPVLFSGNSKDAYKDALARADENGHRVDLYELYYREMLKAHAVFTDRLL